VRGVLRLTSLTFDHFDPRPSMLRAFCPPPCSPLNPPEKLALTLCQDETLKANDEAHSTTLSTHPSHSRVGRKVPGDNFVLAAFQKLFLKVFNLNPGPETRNESGAAVFHIEV